MPKFARPNAYTGKQSNQKWTGQARAATLAETLAGESEQIYISPSTLEAAVATIIGAATETNAGIAEIATQAETNTGTDDARIVTPLKLKTNLASPPAIGGTAPNAGSFTTLSAVTTVAAGTSVTAGTTLTATLGDITALNGNMVKTAAGNKDIYSSVASSATAGANSAGTVTLVGGTATITTTAVTADSLIRYYRQGIGATGAAALGHLSIANIVASTSFDINAVQAADATALQASDVSIIFWEIVN